MQINPLEIHRSRTLSMYQLSLKNSCPSIKQTAMTNHRQPHYRLQARREKAPTRRNKCILYIGDRQLS